jgi:hypothetical protein
VDVCVVCCMCVCCFCACLFCVGVCTHIFEHLRILRLLLLEMSTFVLQVSWGVREDFATETAGHALVFAAAGRVRLLFSLPLSSHPAIHYRPGIIWQRSASLPPKSSHHANLKIIPHDDSQPTTPVHMLNSEEATKESRSDETHRCMHT